MFLCFRSLYQRYSHNLVTVWMHTVLSPGLTEVVIFGRRDDDEDDDLANTVIMRFGELSKSKVNFIILWKSLSLSMKFSKTCIILI